jgi:rhodanese-related sulfurtransferase
MRYFKFGFFTLGVVLLLLNCRNTSPQSIQRITSEEMREISKLEGMQLVDVRTPKEYENGHIPNAQNIDFLDAKFEANIQRLNTSKPVIIYCQRGSRSAKCASKLIANGFVKVYDLDGGFAQWKYSGLQVEN